MTDTTDIKALREIAKKINHRLDVVMGALSPFNPDESAHWDCEKLICDLISQLEAERQRAEALQWQLDYRNEVLSRAIRQREAAEADTEHYRKAWKDKADELAELKGKQVPVAWPDMPFSFEELEQMHGATFANGYVLGWARRCESVTMKGPLFTVPQKPIVILAGDMPRAPFNYGMYAKGWNDRGLADKLAIEAAGGIVKDGE